MINNLSGFVGIVSVNIVFIPLYYFFVCQKEFIRSKLGNIFLFRNKISDFIAHFIGMNIANYSNMIANRKVLYRLYQTPKQDMGLHTMFETHRKHYNNARQTRIDAYKNEQRSVSYYDQAKETTQLRKINPELAACNAQSLQVTLKRLDLAFKAFFRRYKAGEKAGFPRYKTKELFKGWGYASHGDGWKFEVTGKRKASLRISGIGVIKTRGKARTPGIPKTLEIIRRNGKWYAAVTFVCEPKRERGTKTLGMDWGLEHFATLVDKDTGAVEKIKAPMPLKNSLKKLKAAQQELSRKKLGSKRRLKAKQRVVAIHEKIANQRTDFLHKQSAKLIADSKIFITEELDVKSMAEDKSKCRGFHRNTLDSSPATFLAMLRTKAQEAACVYYEVETKIVKPTQTCSRCGHQKPKTLKERVHNCEQCGFKHERDVNSVLVMFKDFESKGLAPRRATQPRVATKRETPSIAASAA